MKLEILPKLKILPLVISGVIISGNSQAAEIEEIVVTATKRATSLQDTPMSISALSGETLEKLGVNDFADFVGPVPGLSQRDNGPGQSRPVIRGRVPQHEAVRLLSFKQLRRRRLGVRHHVGKFR